MLRKHDDGIQQAVADAVSLVNTHSGQTSVHLRFNSTDLADVDLVANSASLQGESFAFTAGFETFNGTVTELADIKTELISH